MKGLTVGSDIGISYAVQRNYIHNDHDEEVCTLSFNLTNNLFGINVYMANILVHITDSIV